VDWKDKFCSELNYQTQQTKRSEIEDLEKTIQELRRQVASLEKQLKDKK